MIIVQGSRWCYAHLLQEHSRFSIFSPNTEWGSVEFLCIVLPNALMQVMQAF